MGLWPRLRIMTLTLQWLMIILYLQIGEADFTKKKVPLVVIGTVGKSVIFPLKIPTGNIRSIVWISHTSLATVDVTRQDPNIIITDSKDNRLKILRNSNYSLQICNLTIEDENSYKGQITLESSAPLIQEYTLHVYEELSKPNVTVNFTRSENGTCSVILQCSMEKEGKNVTYNWISLKDPEKVTTSEGPTLTLSWRPGESEPNFICRVTNPVSNQSDQAIISPEFCPGPLSIYYDKLIIGITVVVLFIVIVVGWIFWKKRRQDVIQFSTNHVQQQESATAGMTIYAQITPNRKKSESPKIPERKESVTIYSTIQSPKEKTDDIIG
ncbi:SLAM family member 9-like isoform X2 [Macrotis lagotis]|uniref:SLAM family member 9-like isoform X2 n=1 Tax=Macrotis lagotis TaxID=92651 RepID=UPI003D685B87